jgi:cell wall-associated NlpC family hydrolase
MSGEPKYVAGVRPAVHPVRRALAYARLEHAVATPDGSPRQRAQAAIVLTLVVAAALLAVLVIVLNVVSPQPQSMQVMLPERLLSQPIVAGNNAAAPATRSVTDRVVVTERMGGWTPDIGRQIAERALHWYDWPYSFAAGNAQGPTYGTAVDAASRNDGHVLGFDCSGLVLYAMAPWRQLDHYAAAQYVESGTWHPSLDSLMPGDLVFWSKDGTIAGVGHVAIYIGGGEVVQAPHSGARITVTPLGDVEPGVIGTVRPLS